MSTIVLALALALACSNAPTSAPAEVPPAVPPPAAAAEAPAAAAPAAPVDSACLHKADLADGKEDKVVHNCANCGLLMEGNATHASTHAGQTFHACSDTCKQTFDKEPDAVLARACAKP
jgi:YHS domain-containing protein